MDTATAFNSRHALESLPTQYAPSNPAGAGLLLSMALGGSPILEARIRGLLLLVSPKSHYSEDDRPDLTQVARHGYTLLREEGKEFGKHIVTNYI